MPTTPDNVTIRLTDAKKTVEAGQSLADTIYSLPLTISLTGDLGTGKTTFLQGFAQRLGVKEHLTSPTYALEQRYQTKRHAELLHIDLYRIDESEAKTILESSDDHEGIRCIEWADRIVGFEADIEIKIDEDSSDRDVRILECIFKDISIPSWEEVLEWRKQIRLPQSIYNHCDKVAEFTAKLSDYFLSKGTLVRPLTLKRSAELHDLLRFMDFHIGMSKSMDKANEEDKTHWEKLKEGYPDLSHESACSEFLRNNNYPEIASIVETHGLETDNYLGMTTEQKLLFYADKRVIKSNFATVDERFEDFKVRYGGGKETDFHRERRKIVKEFERELFGENPPF